MSKSTFDPNETIGEHYVFIATPATRLFTDLVCCSAPGAVSPDAFCHVHFLVQSINFNTREVAARNDTIDLSVLAGGKMTEAAIAHGS